MKHLIHNIFRYCLAVYILMCSQQLMAEERINMDALSIIGNKELPNILYILPWKHSDLPDMVELPLSGLINDALKPIDRKTILRQQHYQKIILQHNAATNLTEQNNEK